MNKLFKILSLIFVVVISVTMLGVSAGQVSAAPKELPYHLTMQDTRAILERRLGQPIEVHAPQAGWKPGLPDSGSSPDYTHYWAVYKRFGLTIIYNSPSPRDPNATITDIIVNE